MQSATKMRTTRDVRVQSASRRAAAAPVPSARPTGAVRPARTLVLRATASSDAQRTTSAQEQPSRRALLLAGGLGALGLAAGRPAGAGGDPGPVARPTRRMAPPRVQQRNLQPVQHLPGQRRRGMTLRPPTLHVSVRACCRGPAAHVCAEAAVSAPSASVELVRNILNDQAAGKVDAVMARQSKNVTWKLPVAYQGDPLGGEFQGKKGVLVYLTRQTAQTKEMQLKDLKVQESGRNEVIAQFRMSGKLASNQRFSTSVTQVWRLAGDGLVASMVAYYDTTSIAKAAGKAKKD